jgi:hypothetical protein
MKFSLINNECNTIEFNEIFEFFLRSWQHGFHLLYNLLDHQGTVQEFTMKKVFIPKHHDFDYLIKLNEKEIKKHLTNTFKEFNIDLNKPIPYDIFKKWVIKDHDLEIVYYNKRLKIAVTLMCLNEIGMTFPYPSYPN